MASDLQPVERMFATVISSFLLVPVLWLIPLGPNAQTPPAPNSDSSAQQDLIARAREAEQKHDFQAAAALYQQYLKAHPDDPAILQRLGLVESLSSNWDAAIPPLVKALQLDHSLWGSALYLGISYY